MYATVQLHAIMTCTPMWALETKIPNATYTTSKYNITTSTTTLTKTTSKNKLQRVQKFIKSKNSKTKNKIHLKHHVIETHDKHSFQKIHFHIIDIKIISLCKSCYNIN